MVDRLTSSLEFAASADPYITLEQLLKEFDQETRFKLSTLRLSIFNNQEIFINPGHGVRQIAKINFFFSDKDTVQVIKGGLSIEKGAFSEEGDITEMKVYFKDTNISWHYIRNLDSPNSERYTGVILPPEPISLVGSDGNRRIKNLAGKDIVFSRTEQTIEDKTAIQAIDTNRKSLEICSYVIKVAAKIPSLL